MKQVVNRLVVAACAAVMLLATGACDDARRQGDAAGRQLLSVWGDTAAMHRAGDTFRAQRDSLPWQWQRNACNRAFAAVLNATGRDSVRQAMYMLTFSPQEFAQFKVKNMLDSIYTGKFVGDSVIDYFHLLHGLGEMFGCSRSVAMMDSAVDARVKMMSVNDQMRIYAYASHPPMLALALAKEAAAPDADTILMRRRLEALKQVYTPEEYATFTEEFNRQKQQYENLRRISQPSQ